MKVRRVKAYVAGSVKGLLWATAFCSLVACGAKRRVGEEMGGISGGVGDPVQFYGTHLSSEQEKELLGQKVYYFPFDSQELNESDVMSIYAHAKRLLSNRRAHVRIEGHTDERGSREYNVALGERRANAVANVLRLKGVPSKQISVVSYGKEKPAVSGHDEFAWSQNRRAIVVYEVE